MVVVFKTVNSVNYHTKVVLPNGSPKRISFSPITLSGARGDCVFSTSDPDIIQAIKSHPRFGSIIVIKSEKKDDLDIAVNTTVDIYSMLPDKDTAIIDDSVTSAKAARVWMQANKPDVAVPIVATKLELQRLAAQNNVIFSNWL